MDDVINVQPAFLSINARKVGFAVDERIFEARGIEEVSLGDFILSGGEPAALAVMDAVDRE